jgi:hypothetical protein
MLQGLTISAHGFHIGAGMLALVTGSDAAVACKAGTLHRSAGTVFSGP